MFFNKFVSGQPGYGGPPIITQPGVQPGGTLKIAYSIKQKDESPKT